MESYHVKIITENGVNFTNIDEARNYWFNAGMRDGISKGILNEGVFTTTESNVLYFDTCELRIGGHRFLLDQAYQYSFSSNPSVATRYALVATVVVDGVGNVTFTLGIQDAGISLVKDKLYKNLNGAGTYQVEIGRFTLTTNGTIADMVRTLDVITGGSGGTGEHFVAGDMTTTTLDAGMKANVTAKDEYDANGNYKKTNFNFEFPATAGTVITVDDVEQENLSFTSDPQTQLDNKVDKEAGKGLSENDYTTAEKNKLGGIEAGANKTIVDDALSSSSENPLQNKVIKTALDNKAGTDQLQTHIYSDVVSGLNWASFNTSNFDSIFGSNWASTLGVYGCRANTSDDTSGLASSLGFSGTYYVEFKVLYVGTGLACGIIITITDSGNTFLMAQTNVLFDRNTNIDLKNRFYNTHSVKQLLSSSVTSNIDIELDDSITNYKYIIISGCNQSNGGKNHVMIPTNLFTTSDAEINIQNSWNRLVVTGDKGFIGLWYVGESSNGHSLFHIDGFSQAPDYSWLLVYGVK